MGERKRYVTDKLMLEVQRLRLKGAFLEEAKGAKLRLSLNAHNSSTLLRLYKLSDHHFKIAQQRYEAGDNLKQILKCIPTVSSSGAPQGNMNAAGNKKKSSFETLIGAWRGSNEAERKAFMEMNKLRYASEPQDE